MPALQRRGGGGRQADEHVGPGALDVKTTGPILAIGAITVANAVLLNGRAFDWRVPLATAAAALVFGGAEQVWAPGAVGLARVALLTTLVVPVGPDPAPISSAQSWWSSGGKSAGAAAGVGPIRST